ncbi:MAG: amidohydrolase, partial [Betaproteobacteria bacterium]|nr:amidohydrolase [Betaproteobacteria bacterium]
APNTPERPWAPGNVHRDTPLEAPEVLREMDAAGVQRAILVPPSLDADRNDLSLAAAQKHPGRFAVMGRLNPDLPDARERVATWKSSQPGMLGLRYSFNKPQMIAALAENRLDWLWDAAEKHQLPVMVLIATPMAPSIERIAVRCPGLKIVLDHLGLTQGKFDDEAFAGYDAILALAKRPNVAIKASALPCYTKDRYPYRRLHPHLKRVYDAFGPRRMFWGTDLSRLPCSYLQAIDMVTTEIPWLSAEDKAWIMGRGLCEWLDWPLA